MEEFHKEMKEQVQAILANLQVSPNLGATGQHEWTAAEIAPNYSALPADQVRAAPDSLFKPTFKHYIACPWFRGDFHRRMGVISCSLQGIDGAIEPWV